MLERDHFRDWVDTDDARGWCAPPSLHTQEGRTHAYTVGCETSTESPVEPAANSARELPAPRRTNRLSSPPRGGTPSSVQQEAIALAKFGPDTPQFSTLEEINIEQLVEAAGSLVKELRAQKLRSLNQLLEATESGVKPTSPPGLTVAETETIFFYSRILRHGYLGVKGARLWICSGCHVWFTTRPTASPKKCTWHYGCTGVPVRLM